MMRVVIDITDFPAELWEPFQEYVNTLCIWHGGDIEIVDTPERLALAWFMLHTSTKEDAFPGYKKTLLYLRKKLMEAALFP